MSTSFWTWLIGTAFICALTVLPAYFGDDYKAHYYEAFYFAWLVTVILSATLGAICLVARFLTRGD